MSDEGPIRSSGEDSQTALPTAKGSPEAKNAREPIFNQMPFGVAALTGVILAVHLMGLIIGQQATQLLQVKFGVVPAYTLFQFSQLNLVGALTPLIAYQFLHGGALHLVMNIAMLVQAGPIAELGFGRNRSGIVRFVVFFLACGICGGLAYVWLNPNSAVTTIGASGAISGVFAGFLWAAIGLAKPNQAVLKPVLVSGAVFLLINVGLAWIGRVLDFVPIAWECHLGGFVGGLILYPVIARLGRKSIR